MAMVTARRVRPPVPVRPFGPDSAGTRMTPREFDQARFVEGWRYELIDGVLVVSPAPLIHERDPNELLGHWLWTYHENHAQGSSMDFTAHEHTVATRKNRRRADRVIWVGLGRLPRKREAPSIIVEFVSAGKRDRRRDYEEKRDEYLEVGVREYLVIDRFQRTLTVFTRRGRRTQKRVFQEDQIYSTDLLPGFLLPLGRLIERANRWPEDESELP